MRNLIVSLIAISSFHALAAPDQQPNPRQEPPGMECLRRLLKSGAVIEPTSEPAGRAASNAIKPLRIPKGHWLERFKDSLELLKIDLYIHEKDAKLNYNVKQITQGERTTLILNGNEVLQDPKLGAQIASYILTLSFFKEIGPGNEVWLNRAKMLSFDDEVVLRRQKVNVSTIFALSGVLMQLAPSLMTFYFPEGYQSAPAEPMRLAIQMQLREVVHMVSRYKQIVKRVQLQRQFYPEKFVVSADGDVHVTLPPIAWGADPVTIHTKQIGKTVDEVLEMAERGLPAMDLLVEELKKTLARLGVKGPDESSFPYNEDEQIRRERRDIQLSVLHMTREEGRRILYELVAIPSWFDFGDDFANLSPQLQWQREHAAEVLNELVPRLPPKAGVSYAVLFEPNLAEYPTGRTVTIGRYVKTFTRNSPWIEQTFGEEGFLLEIHAKSMRDIEFLGTDSHHVESSFVLLPGTTYKIASVNKATRTIVITEQ